MTEMLDDRVALIDLDGTVADYDGRMREWMEKLRSPEEKPAYDRYSAGAEPPHLEARRKLIQHMPGFWKTLARLDLGFEVVHELRSLGFMLHVLTKGPGSTMGAWSEKAEWCRENLPDVSVTITQDKSLVFGRVLVDDYPDYFQQWLKHRPRGLVIAVAQPWNSHIKHPNVVRYDGKNRADLRRALQQAYERKSREAAAP